MTTWNRIHHVGLHDTGEHEDYFSASYMKILLTDKARRTKYISRILNILEHFAFLICASNVVKTWCLILQVVQLAHSLLGKMTHYWLGAIMVLWWGGALSYLSVQAAEVDSQDNDSWLGTTHRAGYKFVSFAIACPFFLPTPIVSCLAFQ